MEGCLLMAVYWCLFCRVWCVFTFFFIFLSYFLRDDNGVPTHHWQVDGAYHMGRASLTCSGHVGEFMCKYVPILEAGPYKGKVLFPQTLNNYELLTHSLITEEECRQREEEAEVHYQLTRQPTPPSSPSPTPTPTPSPPLTPCLYVPVREEDWDI